MRNRLARLAALAPLAALTAACGDRPEVYDAPIRNVSSHGLEDRVALLDDGAHRAVLLTPGAGQELDRASVPVGKSVVRAEVSADRKRLFVLSAGDVPRRRNDDERPSLTVIEGGAHRRFELESPHSGFAIDPEGRYVALFAAAAAGGGGSQTAFVENPNEIVIVDLTASAEEAVTPRTLRSFGGRPQRVTFTPALLLPEGPRRLLVVETDQDLTLLDLDNVRANPRRPEVTVRLTSGASAAALRPAGIVVDDGDPQRNDDARIGVRMENDTNVFVLTLGPADPSAAPAEAGTRPNDFRPDVNLADVGGVAGDIAFVRTEPGLRLAAVVPTARSAVLVDPETSITTQVDLPAPYAKMSLITAVVPGAAGTDTALLYGSGAAQGVAFWSLGRAAGQPYRSVEVVSLTSGIDQVVDVPPPRPQLKVLRGNGANAFFVLNLETRTASPLTTLGAAQLHLSADGERIWAFLRSSPQLAQVTLSDLHPIPLPLDRPIDAVYDVARADGGRSLVAIDARGAYGATVLDALAPDTAASRSYYGLLLENLR